MKKLTLLFVIFVLAIIPFFWLKPGEVNLGGDSSRLYFYDPLSYLKSSSLFSIAPSELGVERIAYFFIPFLLLLTLLKDLLSSPTILICSFYSIIFVLSFSSIYLIITELLKDMKNTDKISIHLVSIIGGLFYVLAPALSGNWDKPLISHNQVFLNPVIFLLLLKFIKSQKILYGLVAVLISFIFAPNFSFTSAPPFFAFYPLVILYFLIYEIFIKKIEFQFKYLLLFLFFILVQSFHLIPQTIQLFDKSSFAAQRLFSPVAVLEAPINVFPDIKLFNNLLAHPQSLFGDGYVFFLFPFILIMGLLLNKSKKSLNFSILFIFLLISMFLETANITGVGLSFYRSLFRIPGFSMFRNFSGQFMYVFYFFYTLVFAISLYYFLNTFNKKLKTVIFVAILIIVVFNAAPFVKGDVIKQPFFQGKKNINGVFVMNPNFEEALSYIKNNQEEGKYLTLPLTDAGYQVIRGKNDGFYIGPSAIGYLSGKKDFPGLGGFGPYQEAIINSIKNNNYGEAKNLLEYLNIKYIFYNSDPYIYDNFPQFPYSFARKYFPDQKSVINLVKNLSQEKIFELGSYSIYSIKPDEYLPHIYATTNSIFSNSPIEAAKEYKVDKRPVIYSIDSRIKNASEIILFGQNNSPVFSLKNNYHLHMHDPYVSTKPGSIVFPLMLLKEKYDLDTKKKSLDEYIDFSLLYSAKRIAELKLWGKERSIWDSNLNIYKKQIEELISYINNSNNSEWKAVNIIKTREQLLYQKQNLIEILEHSNNREVYPIDNIKEEFDIFFVDLKENKINPNLSSYQLIIPQKGVYNITLRTNEPMQNSGNSYVEIGKEKLHPKNISEKLIEFGEVNLNENDNKLTLSLDLSNSVYPAFQNTSEEIKEELKWKSNSQYFLTFDYKTKDNLKLSLYDTTSNNSNTNKKLLLKRNLDSEKWNSIEEFFSTDEFSKGGIFQIESYQENKKQQLEIKNFRLIEIPNLQVTLNKKQDLSQNEVPRILVERVNSTKYKVLVSNAINSYELVLSEYFSKNWKVYIKDLKDNDNSLGTVVTKVFESFSKTLSSSDEVKGKIIANYFNGDVEEAKSQDVFLNSKTFETINYKNLGENQHFVANGYANAWHITPKDVENKTDYELIIELSTQRSFYILMSISIITVFIVSIIILINLIKYLKLIKHE